MLHLKFVHAGSLLLVLLRSKTGEAVLVLLDRGQVMDEDYPKGSNPNPHGGTQLLLGCPRAVTLLPKRCPFRTCFKLETSSLDNMAATTTKPKSSNMHLMHSTQNI